MGKRKSIRCKSAVEVALYDVEAELSGYEVYMWVIENVVREVEDSFSSEGVDKQVLLDMQQIWIDKLKMTNAVEQSRKQAGHKNNKISNYNNDRIISNDLNTQTTSPHLNTTLHSLNQLSNPSQHMSLNQSLNQSISQPLNQTALKNIVLTHTISTAPTTASFNTLPPSEDAKESSLTFQLLNKISSDRKPQLINLQKQIFVPATQLTSINSTTSSISNNINIINNKNNNISHSKPTLVDLTTSDNISSTPTIINLQPDNRSKLLQQLQRQQVQHLQQQHTKHIVIQQQPKKTQPTIRLFNSTSNVQATTQNVQLQRPQQVLIQNPQQIILQKPLNVTQSQQHIILRQLQQQQQLQQLRQPQLQPQLQQAQRQQNILFQRTTQCLSTTATSTISINTTMTTSNSTNSRLPQLDGVGDDEESGDDDDDLSKLEMEALDDASASNGIYDDDEDEERSKPEENLVSDDDISVIDPSELFEVDNLIVCQYTKVNRKKIKSKWEDVRSQSKWSMTFRYGVMNINGKDILFNCLQGDACWP